MKEAQHRRPGSIDKSSGSAWARKIKARSTPSLFWLKSRTPGSHEKLFCASSFWTLNSSSLRMTQQLDNNFFSLAAEIETGKMFFRPDAIKTSLAFLSTTTCQTKGSGFISGLKFNFFCFFSFSVFVFSTKLYLRIWSSQVRIRQGVELKKAEIPRTWIYKLLSDPLRWCQSLSKHEVHIKNISTSNTTRAER